MDWQVGQLAYIPEYDRMVRLLWPDADGWRCDDGYTHPPTALRPASEGNPAAAAAHMNMEIGSNALVADFLAWERKQ